MAFNYRQSLKDEKIAEGEPVDSGVSTTSFPTNFKDTFVARLRDTNVNPERQSLGNFSEKSANDFIVNKMNTLDNVPYFERPQDNLRASNFLKKYQLSFIIDDDEKTSAESTLGYISGDPNSNLKGSFPGGMEVS